MLDSSARIVVTGGAGFIGSAVVRQYLAETPARILNLDKLTYAANLDSLPGAATHPRYRFVQADICDRDRVLAILTEFRPTAIMHLAAESHVDRSIDGPEAFIQTNLVGTFRLLDATRAYWGGLSEAERAAFRFHHVSTDEVFGTLGEEGAFLETTPYAPNSPYSASKAGSDHLVRAWHETYGLPVVSSNCSNNYGPYQFPEKLIPLMILRALKGETLPVYGKGLNVRDWLYVEDHARALRLILAQGKIGESYNVGGRSEQRNIDVVNTLCRLLDERRPEAAPHDRLIGYITDRPGHDLRYAIDCGKIERDLGWVPQENFETGLANTVDWYLANQPWWQRVLDGSYRTERLGLSRSGSARSAPGSAAA